MALTCSSCGYMLRRAHPGDIIRVKDTQSLGVVLHIRVRDALLVEFRLVADDSQVYYVSLDNGGFGWCPQAEIEIVHGFFRVQSTEAL